MIIIHLDFLLICFHVRCGSIRGFIFGEYSPHYSTTLSPLSHTHYSHSQDATEVNQAVETLMRCVKEVKIGDNNRHSILEPSVLSIRWANLIASCAGTSNHALYALKNSGLLAGSTYK